MSVTLATLTLQNPGFEEGSINHWTAKAGASTPPTGTDAAIQAVTTFTNGIFTDNPHSGSYFLWAGGQSRFTRVYQQFDVSAYAASIDTGNCVISGLAGWFISRVDEFDSGQLLLDFLDGSSASLSTTLGAVNRATAVWVHTTLADTPVPIGTRNINVGCHNERNFGTNNDAFWDDFTSPTLVNTVATTHSAEIAFQGDLTFALSGGVSGGGFAIHTASLGIRGELQLGLAGQNFPLFATCPVPPPKTWGRSTPAAKAWDCVTVAPAEECDGTVSDDGDLDVLSGDRLVNGDGYGLKLIG